MKYHSFDHGYFFDPSGGTIDVGEMLTEHGEPKTDRHKRSGKWLDKAKLDTNEFARLATALRDLDRDRLATGLRGVPLSWAVTDEELELIGWILERRAPAVADRMEELAERVARQ